MIEKALQQAAVSQSEQEFAILRDNFNRKISYMRISITDRCNLRCTYCMPAWGFEWMDRNSLLTYDEIFRLVRVAAKRGLYKVRITGGEPLVRDGVVVYQGKLGSLRRFKDDVREVQSGYECGIGVENFNDIKVGDLIESYRIEEVARSLSATES